MRKTRKNEPQEHFYSLTLTDNQLRVVQDALEWFFRIQMGQFFDYSTEVAKNGYEYDKNDPENDEKFYQYIRRRNDSKVMFDAAYRIACPNPGPITADMMTAEDMYAIIKHFRWEERPEPKSHDSVDSYKPIILTDETPIKVERLDENV